MSSFFKRASMALVSSVLAVQEGNFAQAQSKAAKIASESALIKLMSQQDMEACGAKIETTRATFDHPAQVNHTSCYAAENDYGTQFINFKTSQDHKGRLALEIVKNARPGTFSNGDGPVRIFFDTRLQGMNRHTAIFLNGTGEVISTGISISPDSNVAFRDLTKGEIAAFKPIIDSAGAMAKKYVQKPKFN